MKTAANILLTIILMCIIGYVAYTIGYNKGEKEGYQACEEAINSKRLFPELYETLVEEHKAMTKRQSEALQLLDMCDSAMKAMDDGNVDEYHNWRVAYLLTRYRFEREDQDEDETEEEIEEDIDEEEIDESKHMTQAELNDESGESFVKYKEKVEKVYQKVLSSYPKYKTLFQKEKSLWEKYYESVQNVARYGDHGSSEPMYYYDVLRQAIKLRHDAINYVLLHSQGKKYPLYRTKFTSKMVDDAYAAFVDAANLFEEYDEKELKAYQTALRHEQKLWNDWINYRNTISKKMTAEISKAYDNCTNLAIRSKLRQVKNQNKALGVTGHEPLDCILPENCSDNAILEYPGFDKVWAKHCEDTDWYPVFE